MSRVKRKPTDCGFRTGPTHNELYKHRIWLETGNFGFEKRAPCGVRTQTRHSGDQIIKRGNEIITCVSTLSHLATGIAPYD